jgi:glycerol uptake facilitator protein
MPASALGELIGTAMLILLGNGIVAGMVLQKTKGYGDGWLAITTGWALAVFAGVSTAIALGAPGELNPAVTLANVLSGARTVTDAMWHVTAQVIGAMLGATLVWLHYFPHWRETPDASAKLACFCTAPAIRHLPSNLFNEVLGTFVLVLAAMSLGSAGFTGATPATNLGSMLVGAVVWGIGLSLGGTTGYAINPARDLGPRLVHAMLPLPGKRDSDWGYAAVPVVGPLLGAALAIGLWRATGA